MEAMAITLAGAKAVAMMAIGLMALFGILWARASQGKKEAEMVLRDMGVSKIDQKTRLDEIKSRQFERELK